VAVNRRDLDGPCTGVAAAADDDLARPAISPAARSLPSVVTAMGFASIVSGGTIYSALTLGGFSTSWLASVLAETAAGAAGAAVVVVGASLVGGSCSGG